MKKNKEAYEFFKEEIQKAKRKMYMQKLREELYKRKRLNVDVLFKKETIVDIDDLVVISLFCEEKKQEEMIIKLVDKSPDIESKGIMEVSINSPLGVSIYGKRVMDVAKYKVNSNEINVKIKKIIPIKRD